MKAVILNEFGGSDKLVYREDFPKPEVHEGEVLVRIKAAGVNPVDYKIREGLRKKSPINFPLILGWDMAGIVEETGFAAKRFKKGDEVFAYTRRPVLELGSYAEYISLPESYISAKPKSLSFEEAASVPLAGLTAYQSLHDKGNIQKGQLLLILGASGGVGTMGVQLAKIAGAKVIALASSSNNEYLNKIGADEVLNYDKPDWVKAFLNKYPQKADLVFDCVGKDTLLKAHRCVKPGGNLVSIAGQGDQELIKTFKINFLYHFVEPNVLQLDILSSFIDQGKLKIYVSSVFPLHEAAKAHEKIETEHTQGKIVLTIFA
jgi:NADPH:quinone reductase-like Zn-dependent oxidoreductase